MPVRSSRASPTLVAPALVAIVNSIRVAAHPDLHVNVRHIYIGNETGLCQWQSDAHALSLAASEAEALQVEENTGLQQLFRRHRQLPAAGISAAEQGGNAVGQAPDMQGHHR